MSSVLTDGAMLAVLDRARVAMPALLETPGWQSLLIDYEPPTVERLWRAIDDDHRVYLHRIHPCERALFHPHPWPSAVQVLDGVYEMAVGYGEGGGGEGEAPPPVAALLRLPAGARYEMIHPNGWHAVRPIGVPSLSIMVTGLRWDRWSPGPKAGQRLGPMPDYMKAMLLDDVRKQLS